MRCFGKFLLPVLLILIGSQVSAQHAKAAHDSIVNQNLGGHPPVKALLKTSIFAPFYWQIPVTGEYRMLTEIMLGPRQSMQLGASYLTRSLIFALSQKVGNNGDDVSANGFRIQGSYKYYLVNRKYRPEGIFVSLHSSLASVNFHFKNFADDYQNLQHFNVNILLGGQVLIANRVSLEVFFGPGYKMNTYTNHARTGYEVFDLDQMSGNYYRHFKMNLGMNVGIVL